MRPKTLFGEGVGTQGVGGRGDESFAVSERKKVKGRERNEHRELMVEGREREIRGQREGKYLEGPTSIIRWKLREQKQGQREQRK